MHPDQLVEPRPTLNQFKPIKPPVDRVTELTHRVDSAELASRRRITGTSPGGNGGGWRRLTEKSAAATAAASRRRTDGGRSRRLRRTAVGDGGEWPECTVAPADGDGACVSRPRRGETSGGSSGFVRAPIAVWLVSTASSRREEHDGVCCHNKEDDVDQCETEEKKGIMEKIKEKLPAAKGQDSRPSQAPEHEDGKEKGSIKGSIVCIEKIKKKLTSHTKHEDDDEKGNLVN
ncbi:hypothetical protein IGI04_025374 [Brassica rapa subsp. trilocularis]|uniref:Dehydrin n=1 Tax=Brassica rapa subsp. trilocularis TaxID=1813537 RepID=A0ABQ7MBV6_BRACM|nr:hypothetical protein IGI04_025374 [Brassica rapa subsp. trilocularis]